MTPTHAVLPRRELPMSRSTFAVVIASKGRPEILAATVESLQSQTVPVEHVYCAITSQGDIEPQTAVRPEVTTLYSPVGSTRQRNAAIDLVVDQFEIIIFLDDDMQLAPSYIAAALEFMNDHQSVVAFSGHLLKNGDVTRDEARQLIDSYRDAPADYRPMFRCRGDWTMHGCNMVARSRVLKYERFDENLPLYGFAEDYDLSVRFRNYGRVGRFRKCVAVHLETPSGRISEKRVGYAMLANNWYFLRKRVTHRSTLLSGYVRFALRLALLEPVNNVISFAFLGRRQRVGRFQGNLLALRDILFGVSSPGRINEID
jgi:GT2 family glycosyltransferase